MFSFTSWLPFYDVEKLLICKNKPKKLSVLEQHAKDIGWGMGSKGEGSLQQVVGRELGTRSKKEK